MTFDEFLKRLQGVYASGDGFMALCPGHPDKKASLSIKQGEDGRILLHDFAGCPPESVVAAMGLKWADLFPDKPKKPAASSRLVATYDYRDEAEKVLFQCVRYEPKGFSQRRPDPDRPGEWIKNLEGVRRVLFRLPELLEDLEKGLPVFVAEGEKDCLALLKYDFNATCNPMGAGRGKWLDGYTETLTGADVIVVADKDQKGRDHAAAVAASLQGKARSVKVLELPDVNGKPVKDPADFFSAGGTALQLTELVAATPAWTAPLEVLAPCRLEVDSDTDPEKQSEMYYADRLAASLPPIKTAGSEWFSYEVGAWQKTSRDIYRPKAQAVLPESIRSAHRETALLNHLEGRLQVSSDSFTGFYKFTPDGDVLLNVSNGVLRLTPDGETRLEAHDPAHAFTTKTAASYDPKAIAPLFNRILGEALPDEQDRVLFQLCAGNFLLPDCRFEVALVNYGEAGTSKSTTADPIAAALGKTLVSRLTMSQICDPKSYHVPRLQWAAANLGSELDAIEMDDSGAFKALVTGEPVEARPIYSPPFTMQTSCKLWFLANSLPRFKHGSEAELRRTRFLRFDRLPPAKDVTLKARLATERDGVFLWMVAGLVELLNLPSIPLGGNESRQVHDRFKISNDPVGSFVNARCRLDPDSRATKQAMGNAYEEFCVSHALPLSFGNWFFKSLYERWPQLSEVRVGSDGTRERCIDGIALNS